LQQNACEKHDGQEKGFQILNDLIPTNEYLAVPRQNICSTSLVTAQKLDVQKDKTCGFCGQSNFARMKNE
jgi:hypothetical protein